MKTSVEVAALVGVGLIGGSLSAAWREAQFAQRIVGLDANPQSAKLALEMGLVDEIVADIPPEAELIAVCTPSDVIAQQIQRWSQHGAPLFDVGSVKVPILDELGAKMPSHYVPAHPISGSERSGPSAANAQLFRDTTTVLTPTAQTANDALNLVTSAWQAVGANTVVLAPDEHDKMLAVTSHLPHLLAFAFMQQVDEDQLGYTGGGFRDFSRIAAANPDLWWRIMSMNKQELLAATETFQANLSALAAALAEEDQAAGIAALQKAARLRQTLDAQTNG